MRKGETCKSLVVLSRGKFLFVLFACMSIPTGLALVLGMSEARLLGGKTSIPTVVADYFWILTLVILCELIVLGGVVVLLNRASLGRDAQCRI